MPTLSKLKKCFSAVDQVLEVTEMTNFFEVWKSSPWVASRNFVQCVQGKVSKTDVITVQRHFIKNKIYSANDLKASSDVSTVDNSELCSVLFEKSTSSTEEASSNSCILNKVYSEQVLKAGSSEGGQEETKSSEGDQKEATTSSEGSQEEATTSSEGSQEEATTSSEGGQEETTPVTDDVAGCSYIYKQVSCSTSSKSNKITLEQVEEDDGNHEVEFCGGLLSDNKTTKDPEYRQTNQEEPHEIEVPISPEQWNKMYDPIHTNRKALRNGWMQV